MKDLIISHAPYPVQNAKKQNVARDKHRELTIFDILKQIKNISEYRALHVDVTRSYEEIETQINSHIQTILSCIDTQKSAGSFVEWRDIPPQEYFANKYFISINDDIAFQTIAETCNTLFCTKYKNIQRSWFIPSTFRQKYGDSHRVWFPKLAVENKAITRGWNNELSQDGKRIVEFNESPDWVAEDFRTDYHEHRIAFTHVQDPITRRKEYRFVGVFKYEGIEKNKNVYTRIGENSPLIKL